jgi:hypothetical protein
MSISSHRLARGLAAAASLALSAGCGDGSPGAASASATAAPTAAPTTAPTPKGPRPMPPLTVDNLGPYIDGQRADLKTPEGAERLAKIVAGLPLDGKEVTLVTLKKATTGDVLAVVRELGAAGVPTVRIKTDARNDLPTELVVTPSNRLASPPPPCSVTATLGDDFATRVWSVSGGLAKMHKKGMVGPDYSMTADAAKKDVARCSSNVALFSGEPKMDWGLTFNLGGALWANANPEGKLKTLVLLVEPPVAGRPVKVP